MSDTDLEVIPTLFGERHCPEARASIHNITSKNVGLGIVMRGLCKGLVNNLSGFIQPHHLKDKGFQGMIACGSALSRNTILQDELRKNYGFQIEFKNADASNGVALYFAARTKSGIPL